MNIKFTEVSLFFCITGEHIEAFGTSCHMLKSPIAAEIRFLHLKPFTNCHFHFFSIVEYARMG
jgi:hypothetical protein